MVYVTNNPIRSVFYLVIAFLGVSLLWMFYGFEFLALILVIVYVGAIVVLFLFMLMLINLRISEVSIARIDTGWIGLTPILLFIWFLGLRGNQGAMVSWMNTYVDWILFVDAQSNLEIFGEILYNEFGLLLILSSLLLLAAILGVLMLGIAPHKRSRII
jgi:NADH:ubiquinone oxidoreductase subunit 6 (subunit J)